VQYTRLGRTGLKVSRIGLGCMRYCTAAGIHQWTLDEDAVAPFFRQALQLVNASVYTGLNDRVSCRAAVTRATASSVACLLLGLTRWGPPPPRHATGLRI
jgi:1-deoxyxylulose-5-phosphate synthase